MEQNGTKNEQKTSTEYRCKKCTYTTVRKNEYDNHILTAEHQLEQNGPKNEHKMSSN